MTDRIDEPAAAWIGERRFCVVSYRFAGNGPWNYFFEKPPEDARTVHCVGLLAGETERHYLVVTDLVGLEDGRIEPVRVQHYSKDACEIRFL